MKKFLSAPITALILSVVLLISGCSEQDPNAPNGYKTASNEKVDYTLFVPNDWVVDTDDNSLMTSAHVSEYESSNITMIAYTNDSYASETAEDGSEISPVLRYWSDYQNSLLRLFDQDADGNSTYKLETDAETTLMGKTASGANIPAYRYVYTAELGGTSLKYMQVIANHNGNFYLFTFTAAAERYDEYAEEVEELLTYIVFN